MALFDDLDWRCAQAYARWESYGSREGADDHVRQVLFARYENLSRLRRNRLR